MNECEIKKVDNWFWSVNGELFFAQSATEAYIKYIAAQAEEEKRLDAMYMRY